MRGLRAFLAALLGWLASASPAWAGEWELALEENGITVYTRESEGSDNLAFRGVVTLPQSVDEVAAVIEDTASYPAWYARCESAEVVAREPDAWRLVHMKIAMPFPTSDRDVVVRVVPEHSGGTRVMRISTAEGVVPEQSGYVRMGAVEGSWTLEPDPSGGTRVTLEQLNDPGGSLPSWLSNMLVTDQPSSTLAGLRDTVEQRAVSSR